MLLGRAPTRLDQRLRARDRRVGGVVASKAAGPLRPDAGQIVQGRLRRVTRLDASRQIVGGLAHRAEPLAQRVDRVALSEQRRIDFGRADLRLVGRLLRREAIEFRAELGVVGDRRAPLGERARGRGARSAKASVSSANAASRASLARVRCARWHRASARPVS